jgi:hypothetical protein
MGFPSRSPHKLYKQMSNEGDETRVVMRDGLGEFAFFHQDAES